jgi:hypothetical protein
VEWTVAGRPLGDARWQTMQAAYEALLAFEDEARGDWGRHFSGQEPLQAEYQQAWREILSSGTS